MSHGRCVAAGRQAIPDIDADFRDILLQLGADERTLTDNVRFEDFSADTVAPAPAFTSATLSGDKVTLTGTSEAGSTVFAYEGLNWIGIATAGADEKWTITAAADARAFHEYGAVAVDRAGNVGESTGDITALDGPAKNYTVTITAGSPSITVQDNVGAHGGQTFTNIQTLQFADQTLDMSWFTKTASLTSAQIASLVELYIASFNRAPDALGLDYWGGKLSDGMSLPAIAASFFVQPEAAVAYPADQSTETFVSQVYYNVLGRAPDTAGLNYWTAGLQSGSVAKNTFLLAIINGAQGADVQYLANKEAVGMHFALAQGLSDNAWAKTVMSGVDGTTNSIAVAHAQTDGFAAIAATDTSTELVVKILGIAA
jgi:hypothetical protein